MSTGQIIDYASSLINYQQHAELYERLYPWAAEDWVSNPDNNLRHQNINLWMTNLLAVLQQIVIYITVHTHTSATPGSPTSPPILPLIVTFPQPPLAPQNTTGAISNLTGNKEIPYSLLSYINDTTTSVNLPYQTFRRAAVIPINSTLIVPPTKLS
jgi:hypothetical protein